MMRTVVMIHPGALGDVLLALSAIGFLRRKFPGHEFLLCANDEIGELLRDCDVIDGWMSVRGFSFGQLFGGSVEAGSEMWDWLTRCDLAVAWAGDEGGILEGVLRRYVQGKVTVCSPFSNLLSSGHQSDRFLEVVAEASKEYSQPGALQLPHRLLDLGRARLRDAGIDPDREIILLHPGSGSPFKCAKPEMLAEVIDSLRQDGWSLALLEGPADHVPVVGVMGLLKEPVMVLRDLNLGLLAGVLAATDLFVGHDSGVSHLSASLGVDTVALFGPTITERWSPLGTHVTVVRADACRCPDRDAVSRCIERPCLGISPRTLLEICRHRLARRNPSKILTKRLVSDQVV